MNTPKKYRLRIGDKIVGYEKWSLVGWLYRPVDSDIWSQKYIHHTDKDQFTGLCDTKGKEIYEGDIVKYTRKHWYCPGHSQHNKDLEDICKIYWDDKRHGFANDMRGEGGRVYSSGYLGFSDDRADELIIEIIGNVFQNKDLLEERP